MRGRRGNQLRGRSPQIPQELHQRSPSPTQNLQACPWAPGLPYSSPSVATPGREAVRNSRQQTRAIFSRESGKRRAQSPSGSHTPAARLGHSGPGPARAALRPGLCARFPSPPGLSEPLPLGAEGERSTAARGTSPPPASLLHAAREAEAQLPEAAGGSWRPRPRTPLPAPPGTHGTDCGSTLRRRKYEVGGPKLLCPLSEMLENK